MVDHNRSGGACSIDQRPALFSGRLDDGQTRMDSRHGMAEILCLKLSDVHG
jgi:hypothetical protein